MSFPGPFRSGSAQGGTLRRGDPGERPRGRRLDEEAGRDWSEGTASCEAGLPETISARCSADFSKGGSGKLLSHNIVGYCGTDDALSGSPNGRRDSLEPIMHHKSLSVQPPVGGADKADGEALLCNWAGAQTGPLLAVQHFNMLDSSMETKMLI